MLRLVEGFENLAAADAGLKYAIASGSIVAGRIAGNAWQITGGNGEVRYIMPDNQAKVGTGFALKADVHNNGNMFCQFYDVNQAVQISVQFNGSNGINVYRGGNYLASSPNGVLFLNAWAYIEVECLISTTVGTLIVRVNGATVINFSGNTQNTGVASITAVQLIRVGNTLTFDDWYVYDNQAGQITTFIGDSVVYSVLPNAAGTYSQWTPSAGLNYQAVDETNQDGDTTYVASATAGQIDTYNFADIAAFSGTIKGITVTAFARKDDGGSRAFAVHTKSGVTEVDGATRNINNTYQGWHETYETDPNTGAAWTRVNLNAAEFGAKLIS